jgi:hypothetical protein
MDGVRKYLRVFNDMYVCKYFIFTLVGVFVVTGVAFLSVLE